MSLRPMPGGEVPAATAAVARAAFPRGNCCLDLRDALGPIFDDEPFVGLFAICGRPAECPWRLALVTLLQFAEDLSDRRAADAVRGRIDWKYLLGLDLTGPGFDASVLCELERPARRERGRGASLRHPSRAMPGAWALGQARTAALPAPPMCWAPCAPRAVSTASSGARARRRARLRSPRPTGCVPMACPAWTGRHARRADDIHAAREARPRDVLLPRGSSVTGMRCPPPSGTPALPRGCARCPPSRCSGGSGCRPSPLRRGMRESRGRSAAWCAV